MTLEQLLESSADELEKLSTEELTAFFTPFFTVTRPDASHKVVARTGKEDATVRRAKAIAAQFGLDLTALDGL